MQASRGCDSLPHPLIYIGIIMRLFELFETKPAKKIEIKSSIPRNFVAKNAQTTGAGRHKEDPKMAKKGKIQVRGHKHKNKETDE